MTKYLISFDDGAMTFAEEELPDVDAAAHAVIAEARTAGVWVFAAGLTDHEEAKYCGPRRDGHRRPVPTESRGYLGGLRRRRRPLT